MIPEHHFNMIEIELFIRGLLEDYVGKPRSLCPQKGITIEQELVIPWKYNKYLDQ